MVKASEPNEWMALVRKTRDENPGMALKDVLRLASKKRGKSSSEKKHKKRGGMGMIPMLGGDGSSVSSGEGDMHSAEGDMPLVEGDMHSGEGNMPSETALSSEGGGRKRGKRSQKKSRKSKKSQKKSRKSKSKKSSKRRH